MIESILPLAPSPWSDTWGLLPGQASLPGLEDQTLSSTQAIAQQFGGSDWLGPLAPVALSPFFGLTMLSGVATYGPDWLQAHSSLFTHSSMLNNPLLFWIMLSLALITSLPRLTKVSKPLALAAENFETYSAVIILIVVRLLSHGSEASASSVEPLAGSTVMVTAGVSGFSLDVVVSTFAALNVIVINAVKLFLEFLVWLIPVPAIDAVVEAVNKLMCAALMALYCFSPVSAAVVNLLLLLICGIVFGWVYRRLRYYRQLAIGPMLALLLPRLFAQRDSSFTAFCAQATGGLPRLNRVGIRRDEQGDYQVTGRWWWRTVQLHCAAAAVRHEGGLLGNGLVMVDQEGREYRFLHRRWVSTDALYRPTHPTTVTYA
ncbi:hypothetical protein [Aureliella helgolandensis]|uniref:Uncharacterized protein n=1 Tax=Aureliella helgolandensis TaxID=2527968 RepID=A0A518GAK5_9BACT|nr:hypothetical protein [Aureliella helgolandensis]QDV25621.1 hypothetical protein Q31a_39470 [Aureliella helgolandensis]